jgi:hypothetical protein
MTSNNSQPDEKTPQEIPPKKDPGKSYPEQDPKIDPNEQKKVF